MCFYTTFIETVDPEASFTRIISADVLFSVLLHSFFYLIGYFFIVSFFNLPKKYILFLQVLVVVMILGYFARLIRAKDIYYGLSKKMNPEEARKKTIEIMHLGYFKWYFLG